MGKLTRKKVKITNKDEYYKYKEVLDKELQDFTNYIIEYNEIDNIIKVHNDEEKELEKLYGHVTEEVFNEDHYNFYKYLSGCLHLYDYFLIDLKKRLRKFATNTIITDKDGYRKIEYNPAKYWDKNNRS